MRVATFLTAAAIAALTTVGPALAYGPATSSPSLSYLSGGSETASSVVAKKQTMVAFAIVKETGIGYVMVKSDNGRAQQYNNCETRENCISGEIQVFSSNNPDASSTYFNCRAVGGCVKVGKKP